MKKIKLIIFILFIIIFLIIFFFGMFGTSISYLSSKDIKQDRKLNESLINSLKINNIDTIYDKNNKIHYYTLPDEYENKIHVLKLELKDNFKYKLINETLNIIKVDYQKPINVIIYNDKYYYDTKIQLTNLPMVNIESDYDITTNDSQTKVKYINNGLKQKMVYKNTLIKIRGASSSTLPKKSYKITFMDKNYENDKNVSISNFYYGDSLILDAIYRDPSKIRNVLSTEIWNEISNDYNNIDIYSEFIELFINNEYKGLYVLTEPINRKRLKLNKSDLSNSSLLIKTSGWRTIGSLTNFDNISDDIYLDYEIKYPNDENLYERSWEKFLGLISNYYNPNIKTTDQVIEQTFNRKNYLDIIIFNSFVTNMDSCLKRNSYFYMKTLNDKELYTQPWDLEFTYGHYLNNYYDEKIQSDKILCEFFHPYAPKTNKLLIDRYWELRKNILTKENFDNLLDKYENELTKGASLRDSKLWEEYDIKKEIDKIRTWLYSRLEFFDSYVRGLENE